MASAAGETRPTVGFFGGHYGEYRGYMILDGLILSHFPRAVSCPVWVFL